VLRVWEGLTRDEVQARHPDAWAQWRSAPHLLEPAGGETVPAVAARVSAGLAALQEAHDSQTIVLVSHGSWRVFSCWARWGSGSTALDARRRAGGDHRDRVRAGLGDRAPDEHGSRTWKRRRRETASDSAPEGPPGSICRTRPERKRQRRSLAAGRVRRWGYREIVTPTFEFSDVLATGTDIDVQATCSRSSTARPAAPWRSARTSRPRSRAWSQPGCATSQADPARYVTNVFRYDEPRVSHYREFYQAGVELVGLDQPEAESR